MKIRSLRLCVPSLVMIALVGCAQNDSAESQDTGAASSAETVTESRAGTIVEVAARDFAFDVPAELPSGWTTLQFKNLGSQEHFMSISRLPAGKSLEDYINEVAAGAFGVAMDPYYEGEVELAAALEKLGSLIPAWFGQMQFAGGPGLLAPGRSQLVTVNLAPGNYVLECYVKTPEGMFHSALGMIAGLTVTEEASGAPAPVADFDVTLANYVIEAPQTVAAGKRTIRVRVIQDPEGMLKHDVHLFRVGDDTDLAAVIPWMSWIDGMLAPAPVTFVGGFEQLDAGGTGYMHVDLESGAYAWISEAYADRGMVKEFVVE